MEHDKIEKTIIINNKEIVVKMDTKIHNSISKLIVNDFCNYLKQMKVGLKKIGRFKPSDFDYIALMLVIKHCTDFFDTKDKFDTFVDITLKYSELVTKKILPQLLDGISDSELSKGIDQVVVTCRIVAQNEMSINKLESMLPELKEENINIKIIKLQKDQMDLFNDKFNKLFPQNKNESTAKVRITKKTFDDLLDEYSDAKLLYEMFGDEEYEKRMKAAIIKLKKKWKKIYGEEKNQ